jgi:bifunctional non-homologous end joining protein LigD
VDELRAYQTAERPLDPDPGLRGVRWVRPELVCEVEYQAWTDDDRLRAASFKGLRSDKLPRDCRRERAFDEPDQPARQ